MTDHSSASIRPPKNWQDFERNSRILFECILNDKHVQNNGRPGQRQHGVDIFGRENGTGTNWFGIQCKGKDANYGGVVTEKELRKEVEETREFTPCLTNFILITTAPDDASIQKVARTITEEREKEGNPLNVSVWGWGELEARISEHPRALQAFEPDASPYSNQILSDTSSILTKVDGNSETLNAILLELKSSNRFHQTVDGTVASIELLDKTLHAEIDDYRDLLKAGQPRTSLRLLEALKIRIWDSASDRIKFRTITNIGSAKLHISRDNEAEAAENFLEAIRYQPDDRIALANVTLAYLLKDQNGKAIQAAKTALEKDESNAEAASYLIQAYIKDNSVDDPLILVPDVIKESAPVDIAIINFYRTRNDLRWVDCSREAVSRHPENEQIMRLAAEAELETAVITKGLLLGQRPANSFERDALEKAAETLQKLWDKQYNGETPDADSSLPHNLVQLYRIIGKNDVAKAIVIQVIEKIPNDLDIIKLRSVFCLEDNQPQEAVSLLSSVNDDPDVILMLAEIQAANDPTAALKTLENLDQTKEITNHHRILAGGLRIDSWLTKPNLSKADRISEANKEYNALSKGNPESPLVALMHTRILEAADEDLELKNSLDVAKSLLKDDSPFYDRYMIARKFESLAYYSDAADILDGYVDFTHDSPPLRTLLFSLINSDRRLRAYEILSAIPQEIAEQPIFLRAAINLHFRRGDYQEAESAISRLLSLQPNSLQTHLSRVDIWMKYRNDKNVKQFLSTHVENLEGSPEEFMRLAHLLLRFGFHERALELGYRIHIENHMNPQVQLAYIGLMLKPGSSNKITLERDTVNNNTAFTIKNSYGEEETFIIEEDESLRLTDETIPPTHLYASTAKGLKNGEKFQIKNGEEWEIVSVKHKYLHLLHIKMNRFGLHFPDNGGLLRFTFSEEAENPLDPVLKQIKTRHDSIENALDRYTEFKLPLQFFARFLGADVIEVWYSLAQTGRKFKVCHGINPERAAAFNAIEENNKAGCIVDALTLHIIRSLDIEDAVSEVCGRIAVTESTIDVFRDRRERVLSYGEQPFMTVFFQDGHYYREEVTTERLRQILTHHEQELDWIAQRIETLPAESKSLVPKEAGRIRDALSYDFLDPILAAQGSNMLLLCEDQCYRQFGISEFNLRATWLQPVLMLALNRKILSRDKYEKAIFNLIAAGHDFTSLDADILIYALAKGEEYFQTAAKALFSEDAEIDSHRGVMLEFLVRLWGKRLDPPLGDKKATSIMLQRLFGGEWKSNIQDATVENIASLLQPLISGRSRNPGFTEYLVGWLEGHFLIPCRNP